MNRTHTLTRHRDIQAWVLANRGLPAIRRMPDQYGAVRPRLALRFARPRPAPVFEPPQDEGLSPVSWSAWLAELDRQRLALKVIEAERPSFEFVELRELN